MRKKQTKHTNRHELSQIETVSEGEPIVELPYDDDPEWNASFEKSLPVPEKLAAKALNNFHKVKLTKLPHDE